MFPLRAPVAAPLLFAAGLGLGCLVWEPLSRDQSLRDPKRVAEHPAVHLRPGDTHAGELDCGAGRCDQWFRVRIERSGTLRVELRVDDLAERAFARLFLQDAGGKTLATAHSSEGLPLRVESPVEPGTYAVLIHAGGGPVAYTVESAIDGIATPSPQPGSFDPYPFLQPGSSDLPLHRRGKLVLHFPPRSCLTKTGMRKYYQEVNRAIAREWSEPAGLAPEQAVSLRLRLAESGELLEATAAPDVDARLAASALEAVRRAAPFAPIPSDARCLRGKTLDADSGYTTSP